MMSLNEKLKAEKTCPVCGLAAIKVSVRQRVMRLVRYECGAVFGISKQLDAIEPYEPCPTPSRKAADRLMAEMALALAGAV